MVAIQFISATDYWRVNKYPSSKLKCKNTVSGVAPCTYLLVVFLFNFWKSSRTLMPMKSLSAQKHIIGGREQGLKV